MVKINSISENLRKIIKFLLKNVGIIIVLLFVISIVNSFMTADKEYAKQTKTKEKPDYIPADIEKKYPEDFKSYGEFLEKVKKNAVKSDKKIEEDRYHAKYYDSKGREIYIIDELWGRKKNSWHGGRSGAILERAFPDEKGILYDENGNIAEKLEIQTTGSQTYHSKGTDDEPRRNLYETGFNLSSNNKYTRYYYDEKNKLIKEVEITPSNWFIKNEIEYKNGKKKSEKKIIDYEVTYKKNNRIYVEITKEYDKNEKLIKKFVLRKNRVNAVRSETNFDFIKGEIVTKYYDGEKAFATVTETLIGKDRAIVKRERVGDEFVIWDCFTIKDKVVNFMRYVLKNNEIEKIFGTENNFREIRKQYYEYNDEKSGIKNTDFIFYTYSIAEIQKFDGIQKYIWDGIVKEISSNGNLIVEEKEIGKTLYSLEDLKISTPEEDFTSYLYNLDKTIKEKLFKNEKEYNISKKKYEEIKNKFKEQIGGF